MINNEDKQNPKTNQDRVNYKKDKLIMKLKCKSGKDELGEFMRSYR